MMNFFSVNNLLRECDDMKGKIKNLKTSTVNQKFESKYKIILSYSLKTQGLKKQKMEE